jgi:hypothetical protein
LPEHDDDGDLGDGEEGELFGELGGVGELEEEGGGLVVEGPGEEELEEGQDVVLQGVFAATRWRSMLLRATAEADVVRAKLSVAICLLFPVVPHDDTKNDEAE